MRGPGPLGRMTLRWRLVLAFLSVSVLPVLLSSFLAAQVIATLFERNLESWLGDAARFMAEESLDAQHEAERAVAILAAGLGAGDVREDGPFVSSARLLATVGYDLVVVYDAQRRVLHSYGRLDKPDWLPLGEESGFYMTETGGDPSLMVGASRRVQSGDQVVYVFLADLFNETYVDLSSAISSLDVKALRVQGGRTFSLLGADHGAEVPVPPPVLARLAAGERVVTAPMLPGDDLAAGFAPIRDAGGRLIAVLSCRLSRDVAYLAHVRTWSLFLVLSLCAGLLSLVVGLLLSKRIAGPLHALSGGLRDVREGNYAARLRPTGGQELQALAHGFNDMAAQLDALRRRETEMRRREQLASLGEAAAAIAHEIRNPLGIIKTSSQVLRMKQPLPEASDRLVGFVLDEVGRIDRLVQDLLDYVRPEDTSLLPLDLHDDVVAGTLAFAMPEMERRGITVSLLPPQGGAPVLGSAPRLRQVLLNLVLNAADAMPQGGRLMVETRRRDGVVTLTVRDTGAGIAAPMRARLFEPFVTDKPRGTGLGLALVWSVLERHGGQVSFTSEPGAGTSFVLTFPCPAED